MAVSKKRKKILFIILIVLIALFLRVHMIRKLPQQIQGLIKYKVSSDVVKKQDELYEAVVEMNNQEVPRFIERWEREDYSISYKQLNNEKISRVFKDLSVWRMGKAGDNSEYNYVFFLTSEYWIHLNRYFHSGFYYIEEDIPMDIITGDYVSDVMILDFSLHYRYRTEKITDNWWYFEQWAEYEEEWNSDSSIIGKIEGIIDKVFPPEFSE